MCVCLSLCERMRCVEQMAQAFVWWVSLARWQSRLDCDGGSLAGFGIVPLPQHRQGSQELCLCGGATAVGRDWGGSLLYNADTRERLRYFRPRALLRHPVQVSSSPLSCYRGSGANIHFLGYVMSERLRRQEADTLFVVLASPDWTLLLVER